LKKKYTSVFFGTPDFALPSLQTTLLNTRVLGCVTQPDRPRGRGQKLSPCPVKTLAMENKVSCFSPPSLRKRPTDGELAKSFDEFFEWKKQLEKPDFLIVTAYGNILPQEILDWPKFGALNVHASLLPKWRGAAPIQRSIEAGDQLTGVSLQKMIFELDAGDVLLEKTLKLKPQDTAQTLSNTLSTLGGTLLNEFFDRFDGAVLKGAPQNSANVSFAKKIDKFEGYYSPTWTDFEFDRRVKAFLLWPSVKVKFLDQQVKILETKIVEGLEIHSPGSKNCGDLTILNNSVFLTTRNHFRPSELGFVEILKVQFAGKAPMPAFAAFQNFFHQNSKLSLCELKQSE